MQPVSVDDGAAMAESAQPSTQQTTSSMEIACRGAVRVLLAVLATVAIVWLHDSRAPAHRAHPEVGVTGAWSQQEVRRSGHRALLADQVIGYSPPGPNGSCIPGYRILRRVPGDSLDMAGGWYALEVDYKFPAPDPKKYFEQYKGTSCSEIARHHVKQPLDDLYKRRHGPPTALPGGVPRTIIRWEGNITRQQFDAVPDVLHSETCPFCTKTTRYQIIDGHLYREGTPEEWASDRRVNLDFLQDLLLVAIHLWDLPDMDFILHNGDGCPPEGVPALSWTICRNRRQGGFGFPSYPLWRIAKGPVQNEAYHACMVTRYNHTNKHPVVFWRGSTTDPSIGGELMMADAHKIARIRLHRNFRDDPVFDTKIHNIILADDDLKAYLQPLGTHPREIEDYSLAAVILDVDGHGISGRFGQRYVDYGTPVIKQASNNTAYFEHLMAQGYMVEYCKNDLSDLKDVGHRVMREWNTSRARLVRMAENLQGFAAVFMHQIAIAEAAAYSLLEYSKRLTWKTVRDPAYTHVPFSSVCKPRLNVLPKEFCEEIQARPERP